MSSIRIFISYSHENEIWLTEWEDAVTQKPNHRYLLKQWQRMFKNEDVVFWYDREKDEGLRGGDSWRKRIFEEIDNADIAVLLVSQDFVVSPFIMDEELPRLLDRHRAGKMEVLPIIVQPTRTKDMRVIGDFLQWTPGGPIPLSEYLQRSPNDFDKAKIEILDALESVILNAKKRKSANEMPDADDSATAPPAVPLSQEVPVHVRVSTHDRTDDKDIIISEPSGIELVRIPGGEFLMGSPANEEGRSDNEGPQHKVRVKDFYLGRYPVTNEEYSRFLKENPDTPKPRDCGDGLSVQQQPVIGVSWNQARAYCEWASLRLPTEAEWEHACRAGTTTRFWSGDSDADLARVDWCLENSGKRLHSVGEKEPNPFGLFDMHGNVREWVADVWHVNYNGAPTDGSEWVEKKHGNERVNRGGHFGDTAGCCRSASRRDSRPKAQGYAIGFRVSRSIPVTDPTAVVIADKSEGSDVSGQGPNLRSAIPEINGAPIVVTKKRITDTKTDELGTLPTNPVPATLKPGISSARRKADNTEKRHNLSSFVVSYDEDYLIGADNHGWVRKWLLPSQEIVAERQFPRAVQLHQDPFGSLIVASTQPDNLNQGDLFLISWNSLEPVARKAYQGDGPYWGFQVVFTSEQIIATTQRIERNGMVMKVSDQLTVFDKATYKATRIQFSSMGSRLLNPSPDGKRVAMGTGLSIGEYDILRGEPKLIRKVHNEEPTPKMEWKGMSRSIISPDWNYIVHGHTQGRIRTFRYDNLEMINTVTQPFNGEVVGFQISISPSGHRCVWNDFLGWVRVFSLPEAKPIAAFEGLTESIQIYNCVFSPDSKLACVYPWKTKSESVSPRVINLDDGQLESQLHELNGGVLRVQFVGNTLYTLDGEGRLMGWNINNWSQVCKLEFGQPSPESNSHTP